MTGFLPADDSEDYQVGRHSSSSSSSVNSSNSILGNDPIGVSVSAGVSAGAADARIQGRHELFYDVGVASYDDLLSATRRRAKVAAGAKVGAKACAKATSAGAVGAGDEGGGDDDEEEGLQWRRLENEEEEDEEEVEEEASGAAAPPTSRGREEEDRGKKERSQQQQQHAKQQQGLSHAPEGHLDLSHAPEQWRRALLEDGYLVVKGVLLRDECRYGE